MLKEKIHAQHAPAAIGPYSQAIKTDKFIFLSGQIPLDPVTMALVAGDIAAQAEQVFNNLREVCKSGGGDLSHIVKLTIYLTDLSDFAVVNAIMTQFFTEPYPARATIQVSALPKEAKIEVDGIMVV